MRSCPHAETECPDCKRERYRSIGIVGHKVDQYDRFRRDALKHNENELAEYRRLRAEGQQPNATHRLAMDQAKEFSDRHGVPWRGDQGYESLEQAGLTTGSQEYTDSEKEAIRKRES